MQSGTLRLPSSLLQKSDRGLCVALRMAESIIRSPVRQTPGERGPCTGLHCAQISIDAQHQVSVPLVVKTFDTGLVFMSPGRLSIAPVAKDRLASINRTLGFRFWPKIQINDLHVRCFAGTGRDEFQICSAFLDQLRCDGEAHCSISV